MLESEINTPMLITSIALKRSPIGEGTASFQDLKVYMGTTDLNQLTLNYMNNYDSAGRTLVLSADPYPVTAVADQWFTVNLNTPYWYNGDDNLIIEFEWSDGEGSIYAWHWTAGSQRAVFGNYGASSGDDFETSIPHLQLNGTLALEPETFASIKAGFGQE